MSKYTPLTEWLKRQPGNTVELTFNQIERIINKELPDGARRHLQDWDYRPPGTSLSNAWNNAGFQIVMVDMENEKVKLRRKQGV
ncbi:MAG: hypothetical protein V3R36_04295 [Dehalococcoidales bacterium]